MSELKRDLEGWTDASSKLPKEGEVVRTLAPWLAEKEAMFGYKDGKPTWYATRGRLNTLPAVQYWRRYEDVDRGSA